MDTQKVIRDAEQTIALARLAEALRGATACILRQPPDSFGVGREVVVVCPNPSVAEAIVAAMKEATKYPQ